MHLLFARPILSCQKLKAFSAQRQFCDRLRILVVDNYPDICELFALVLEEIGAEVVTANSCAKALTHIQANPPDVLISEIFLPDENGLTLIRKARDLTTQASHSMLAIAVTSYTEKQEQEEICAAGFQKCLSKRVDVYKLVEVVISLITERDESQ
ncbi:MAG: response regulator [Leptolyngbyaceae cyanobacterium CSU_1_4]|nr:response regulator [Leptolyngbyaceae cyanobacterium CSU_1_4]